MPPCPAASKYHICDSFRDLNHRKMKFEKTPIPLPMPHPSKRKVAARKQGKDLADTASEWEETHSSSYTSETESPDSTSELESDCEDSEEWRYEQRRLYSLAYNAPPMKTVSQGKC